MPEPTTSKDLAALVAAKPRLEQVKVKAQIKALAEGLDLPSSNVEGEEFEITAYCSDYACTGIHSPEVGGHGLTKSGKPPKVGVTIAADPKVLPLGTKVEIEGLGPRTVEDVGGAIKGKRIDVYMPSHEEALKFGRRRMKVRKVKD
jgi:3D (Asp-Asp-Asp) domain-containing protein